MPFTRVKTQVSPVPPQDTHSRSNEVTVKSSPGPVVSCSQNSLLMPSYLYDPLLAGRVLPPRMAPVTEDRGCSPVGFPEPEGFLGESSNVSNSVSNSATSTDDLRTLTHVNTETSPRTPSPAPLIQDVEVQTSDVEDDLQQQYMQSGLHPDQANEGFLDNGTPILSKIDNSECVDVSRAGSQSPPPPQLIKEVKSRDSPAPLDFPAFPKDSLASFCDKIFSSAEMVEMVSQPAVTMKADLSYLEPEISKASDGLELLSVLATHAQKQASVSSTAPQSPSCRSDTPDINCNYNAPKAYMLEGFTPLEPPSRSKDKRTEDWLTSTEGLGSPFRDTFDFSNFPAGMCAFTLLKLYGFMVRINSHVNMSVLQYISQSASHYFA